MDRVFVRLIERKIQTEVDIEEAQKRIRAAENHLQRRMNEYYLTIHKSTQADRALREYWNATK